MTKPNQTLRYNERGWAIDVIGVINQYCQQRRDIKRGARRGWDPLFYPQKGHGIETEFIKPVLKSSKSINGLLANALDDAFCCNSPTEQLKANQQLGAARWIARFELGVNEKNRPLPEVLKKGNSLWYEMNPNELADFVISINPDKRLRVHRLEQRAFVNQRLIRLSNRYHPEARASMLQHALLNSVVGMFLIEAIGFGRGLGALDLNASKLAANLHMLNPAMLRYENINSVLAAFEPLLVRRANDLDIELTQNDRIHFDTVVLNAYGLEHLRPSIYAALLANFHIRQTARS